MNITATHNVQVYLTKTWNLLTAPAQAVQVPEQRRQAQFLASVLLVIIPVIFVTSFLKDRGMVGDVPSTPVFYQVTLLSMPVSVVAYVLSRTRHYKVAAVIAVMTASASVFATMFPENVFNLDAVAYLIVPVLLSSILLSMRTTFFVILIQMSVLTVVAFARDDAQLIGVLLPALRFQFMGGLLVLFGAHFRNQLANDRNSALIRSEEFLRKANEELEIRVAERTAEYKQTAEELRQSMAKRDTYERALANERNLLRTVIDNLPDHIFAVDRSGRYILTNQSISTEAGEFSPEQLLGKSIFDVLPKAVAERNHAEEQQIIKTRAARLNVERKYTDSGGRLSYYVTSKIPLPDADGNITGIVFIDRNINEQKQTQQRLHDAYSELEQRVSERTAELSDANGQLRDQIAQRQQVEEKLQYQANLLENVSDAIISVDSQFMIKSWNKAAEMIYGWTAEEATGKSVYDMTGSDLSDLLEDSILAQVAQTGSWHGETIGKRKDGTLLNVMVSLSELDDLVGNSIGMVFVNRNVTERKQVEATAHEQRILAEALRDTSATINSTLNLQDVLDHILVYVERVLPYDSATIMLLEDHMARVVRGRGFEGQDIPVEQVLALRFDIDKHANLKEMYETARAIVIPETKDHPAWRTVPETAWIHSYVGAPILMEGQVIGFLNLDSANSNAFNQTHADKLLAFADQTGVAILNANLFEAVSQYADEQERRVAERTAELVNERAQLQAIMDSMAEGVFGVVFGEKPTKYANVAFQKLTGYSSVDWSFDLLRKAVPDDHEEFAHDIDLIYEQLTHSGVWLGEGPVQHRDGTSFDAQIIVTRIDNMDGHVIGTVTIIRDVSQTKALEKQKSLFVANASHELRTPITNLMTRLYLLKKQPNALETHLEVLDEIARRMRTLVEDLLDHSRFERGVIPLEPKMVDVRDLISQVVNLQTPEAEKKHIDLLTNLPETKLTAMVDPERMIQVITNLVINAVHYTPEGGKLRLAQVRYSMVARVKCWSLMYKTAASVYLLHCCPMCLSLSSV
ncbi:MAG: PAS domain S-box protein [Anaerolineae bacterium]